MAPLSYHQAKKILEQQKLAEEVMQRHERLKNIHEEHGFQRRRDLIRVLEDLEAEDRRLKGGRGTRGLPQATVDQIHGLKAEGKSNAEISRITGASPLTVAKYVKAKAGPARAKGARTRGKAKKAAGRTRRTAS